MLVVPPVWSCLFYYTGNPSISSGAAFFEDPCFSVALITRQILLWFFILCIIAMLLQHITRILRSVDFGAFLRAAFESDRRRVLVGFRTNSEVLPGVGG